MLGSWNFIYHRDWIAHNKKKKKKKKNEERKADPYFFSFPSNLCFQSYVPFQNINCYLVVMILKVRAFTFGVLLRAEVYIYWCVYIISIWSDLSIFDSSCATFLTVLFCVGIFMKLTFTTIWANSADNKLVIFFLFFIENRIWHL